ncbi:MAG: FkbM family methyltransferase [Verrucomicrobiota bacterium]
MTHPAATTKKGRKLSWLTRYRLNKRLKKDEKLSENDEYIFKELKPGDIAIDCGANVGKITELMAQSGATVHAFEPDPNAFPKLQEKCQSWNNVTLHNAAVAAEPGSMKLFYREEHHQNPVKFSVGSTLHTGKTDIDHGLYTEVEVLSFADFVLQLDQQVRILKMDIEGSEIVVLQDLLKKDLLDRFDLVLVETHEEWIPDTIPPLKEIKHEVQAKGYKHVFFNWI